MMATGSRAPPEIADVIARLHRFIARETLGLPVLDPFANAVHRIDANTWLTPDDRAFLTATLTRLQGTYATLEYVLQSGVISVVNVLLDSSGAPALIDLDGFAIGPRE
jgi:hypothetical protein